MELMRLLKIRKDTFLMTLILGIILVTLSSCNLEKSYPPGGPYYYASFASYKIPVQPIGELTPDEAKAHEAYYVAYFNDQGKIVSFTKYLRGKIESRDQYIYGPTGLLEYRELTQSTGEVVIQPFDKNGKMITP